MCLDAIVRVVIAALAAAATTAQTATTNTTAATAATAAAKNPAKTESAAKAATESDRLLIPAVAAVNGDVAVHRIVVVHDAEDASVANDGITFLVENGVEQFNGFLACDGLIAPDVDLAIHRGVEFDDEAGRVAEVVQHHFDRRAA